jgi:hypothetical protein
VAQLLGALAAVPVARLLFPTRRPHSAPSLP